jgi:HEAT repeat protein
MVVFAASGAGPLTALDRLQSSALILCLFAAAGALAFVLYRIGFIGAVLGLVGAVVRGSVRAGFRTWRLLLSWAPWPVFLGLVVGLIVLGLTAAPGVAVLCGLAALFMGTTACLAYMYIDLERYEVARGYKAVHEPLKGQALAADLVRYGDRVGVPLLAAAAVGVLGGFALLNQGLYETVGQTWYAIGEEKEAPGYVDFVAYSLINLYRIVDFLDLSDSYHLLHFTYVRQAKWPAATLLTAFKTFFTLVLLQQIFASIRQGFALAEAIADFWSPHPPIHERARNSLPQHGVGVIRPLLASLREVPALTKEQREQLPRVIAGIGPASVPVLVEALDDPHEGVRAVAAAALGLLHGLDALPALAELKNDPSDLVRQEVVGALGTIGGPGVRLAGKRSRVATTGREPGRFAWVFGRRGGAAEAHRPERVELAVFALRDCLSDPVTAVRVGAAQALGQVGPAAAPAVPDLVRLLRDDDETVRCRAAEALGVIGDESAVPALAENLGNPSPAVQEAAARALGAFKQAALSAVPALVPLLRDPEDSVRQAAADALSKVGPLPGETAAALAEGLSSPDSVVQTQTAEAIGAIGEAAAEAAPALVEALTNGSDRVRAKAAEALGKMGEAAAPAAVPKLVVALRDEDNWVSALAAEALGEMGEAAEEAVPALVRSLRHINPLVRANAAEALGKMGEAARDAVPAAEAATRDKDGNVRAQALRALGEIAPPGGSSDEVFLAAVRDPEPRVRAAAAEALGKRGAEDDAAAGALVSLLEDPSDEVKFQVVRALPRLAGPTTVVIEGLCRRLLEDDSAWIRETAAQALGSLGPAAAAAGESLLRAARTGEVPVREEAMRAIALIQPPETVEALTGGMTDASPEVRKVASAGWTKAAAIPETAVPALVEALRDPEVQVRANAARALARLEPLPPDSVPLLIECAADPNDGLRLNAVAALRRADLGDEIDVLGRLVGDPNSRVRLIAAGAVLARDPADADAAAVVTAALSDPALRLRQVGLEAIAALGDRGLVFQDILRRRAEEEEDPALRRGVNELLERLEQSRPPAEPEPA